MWWGCFFSRGGRGAGCGGHGILPGDAGGALMPPQPVTRQQLCTMLYRFAKLADMV